jgi:hypothetical protein
MFTEKDLQQFYHKGISPQKVQEQIDNFKTGFPFINLFAPATPEFGLKQLSPEEEYMYLQQFKELFDEVDVVKFVPASGAASRMFKHLFEFAEKYTNDDEGQKIFEKDKGFNSVHNFFANIEKFAFYNDLNDKLSKNGFDLTEEIEAKNYGLVLNYLLQDYGLGYASLPKGLLRFHLYDDYNRFAVEEHLVEAAIYGTNSDGIAKIHFTVSPEHQEKFESTIDDIIDRYERIREVKFEISFSQQKPSTDTVSVNLLNEPFREDDGTILFRPGGHGALIENLNDIDADVVYIKNIDNVIPDRLKDDTFKYKKLIGSYLMSIQSVIHNYLYILEDGNPEDDELDEMYDYMETELFIEVPSYIKEMDSMEQIDWLFEQLNRPVRVCGMVKNEGEPGGGPFIVLNEDGTKSLQIVESSQIDFSKPEQAELVKKSTHFNPVDLVCALKDYNGLKFDLTEFVDEKTGFISEKSKGGKALKAQELPGLWNGAMANWITVFMEVPISTFNPVKTVNDLLRDQHQ